MRPVVTSPSSVSSPSRPSKRESAPRPQRDTKPSASAAAPVSANDVPVTNSRPLNGRHPARPPAPSPRRSPFAPPGAIHSRSAAIAARSEASSLAAALPPPSSQNGSAWPANVARNPAALGAARRPATASRTWSVTVRPNRPSHAAGIRSVFSIRPTARRSPSRAPRAFSSLSTRTSVPSSCASSSTATATVFAVSPGAKLSVPLAAS